MDKLQTTRAAFADLLNALDEARDTVTERGEEEIDSLVADVEVAVRRFDAVFGAQEARDGE